MRCEDCLTVLATASSSEIESTTAIAEHTRECAHCSATFQRVIAREQHIMRAFSDAAPLTPSSDLSDVAVHTARRQRVARLYMAALIGASAIVFAFGVGALLRARTTISAAIGEQAHVTESIDMHCLTPVQAGEIVQGYLRSNGSIYWASKPPLRVLTVSGTAAELVKVHAVLERYDGGAACSNPQPANAPRP